MWSLLDVWVEFIVSIDSFDFQRLCCTDKQIQRLPQRNGAKHVTPGLL
jgi:hypothetical protein